MIVQSLLLLAASLFIAGLWWMVTLPIKLGLAQARNLRATTENIRADGVMREAHTPK
jgi:hypothetical protein